MRHLQQFIDPSVSHERTLRHDPANGGSLHYGQTPARADQYEGDLPLTTFNPQTPVQAASQRAFLGWLQSVGVRLL